MVLHSEPKTQAHIEDKNMGENMYLERQLGSCLQFCAEVI